MQGVKNKTDEEVFERITRYKVGTERHRQTEVETKSSLSTVHQLLVLKDPDNELVGTLLLWETLAHTTPLPTHAVIGPRVSLLNDSKKT